MTAFRLAFAALGLGRGDEVITSCYTFVDAADCIRLCDARPVFVDIEPRSLNLDPTLISRAITEKTRAIMPCHVAGQPADMAPILDIAEEHGLAVIEDASHRSGC